MSDLFDIQPAADAILNGGDLVKAQGLPPDRNRFDAGESDGFFQGNVPGGLTLTGKHSLLVQGSIEGASSNICHVDVAGDAIVTGDVRYSRINCRHLRVAGDVHHAQVNATGEVFVGSDLVGTRLLIGDYQTHKQRVERLRHDITRLQEERISLDRRIVQDEKRLDRSCKITRIPLDFQVSRLIFQEESRIRVDLNSIYKSLGDPSDTKLKQAVNEFFAKGVIGYLAKTNRKYIVNNPAREKVFLQLLKHLRELVMEVFERDQAIAAIDQFQTEIDGTVRELRHQDLGLHIRGAILPESEVEFARPRVQRLENSDIDFQHQSVTLKVQPGPQPDTLRLERVDFQGESLAEDIGIDDLQGVSLRVDRDQIIWEPCAS
jgi:hypothetical protein